MPTLLFSDPAKSTRLIFPVRAEDTSQNQNSALWPSRDRTTRTYVIHWIYHSNLNSQHGVRPRRCVVQIG